MCLSSHSAVTSTNLLDLEVTVKKVKASWSVFGNPTGSQQCLSFKEFHLGKSDIQGPLLQVGYAPEKRLKRYRLKYVIKGTRDKWWIGPPQLNNMQDSFTSLFRKHECRLKVSKYLKEHFKFAQSVANSETPHRRKS